MLRPGTPVQMVVGGASRPATAKPVSEEQIMGLLSEALGAVVRAGRLRQAHLPLRLTRRGRVRCRSRTGSWGWRCDPVRRHRHGTGSPCSARAPLPRRTLSGPPGVTMPPRRASPPASPRRHADDAGPAAGAHAPAPPPRRRRAPVRPRLLGDARQRRRRARPHRRPVPPDDGHEGVGPAPQVDQGPDGARRRVDGRDARPVRPSARPSCSCCWTPSPPSATRPSSARPTTPTSPTSCPTRTARASGRACAATCSGTSPASGRCSARSPRRS